MKAYCINLDSRPDRLAHVTNEFGRHGMAFERIAAVDGKHPAITAAAQVIPPMWTGHKMSAGAYACLQSHRKIWQRLLDSGASHAMVFEDDLKLAEGIASYLHNSWVPDDADVVKLETFGTRTHIDRTAATTVYGRKLHRLRATHVGSGAYVLTATAAQRFLTETDTRGDPVDEVLFNDSLAVFPSLTVYQMFPAPAIQAQRLNANSTESWAMTSLYQRTEENSPLSSKKGHNIPIRVWRRFEQELRARLRGTDYVVIPHG